MEAGVSRATVSRVVNGSSSVDAAMTRRVQAAVEKLHYVPNQAARSLMTQRTNTVALVAAESEDRFFGDPFFSQIIRGVSMGLRGTGWQLTMLMTRSAEDAKEATGYLCGGHVDGAMVISEHGDLKLAADLVAAGVPVVFGGRPIDPSIRVGYVDHNNVAGAELAARHLLSTGRRRIATITGPQDMSAGIDRLIGFSRGAGAAFDPDLVVTGQFTSPSGAQAMAELLERAPDVDGVFAASDLMAIGALQTLVRAGRRVPEDVALVGYDDIALAQDTTPQLTTIRQDTVEQGRRMAQLIVATIEASARPGDGTELEQIAEGVILPVRLVRRDSA